MTTYDVEIVVPADCGIEAMLDHRAAHDLPPGSSKRGDGDNRA